MRLYQNLQITLKNMPSIKKTLKNIIKELNLVEKNMYPIKEYNDIGLPTYEEYEDGYKIWYKYDEHGNTIGSEDSEGNKERTKFNDLGLPVKFEKLSTGFVAKWKYNDNGDIIKFEDSEGKYIKSKYTEDYKLLKYEDHTGKKLVNKYDKDGRKIYRETNDTWAKTKYNDEGKIIYSENDKGDWVKREGKYVLEKKGDKYYLNNKEYIVKGTEEENPTVVE